MMHLVDVTASHAKDIQRELAATPVHFIKVYTLGNSRVVYKKKHGFSPESVSGVLGGFFAHQPAVLLLWRTGRNFGGRAAGYIAPEHGGHAAAVHLWHGADIGSDHAGRHLLWRAVRRLDVRHTGQCAGRDFRSGHLFGRPSAGQAGQGRQGAGHRRHRFVHRRYVRHAAGGRHQHAAFAAGAAL